MWHNRKHYALLAILQSSLYFSCLFALFYRCGWCDEERVCYHLPLLVLHWSFIWPSTINLLLAIYGLVEVDYELRPYRSMYIVYNSVTYILSLLHYPVQRGGSYSKTVACTSNVRISLWVKIVPLHNKTIILKHMNKKRAIRLRTYPNAKKTYCLWWHECSYKKFVSWFVTIFHATYLYDARGSTNVMWLFYGREIPISIGSYFSKCAIVLEWLLQVYPRTNAKCFTRRKHDGNSVIDYMLLLEGILNHIGNLLFGDKTSKSNHRTLCINLKCMKNVLSMSRSLNIYTTTVSKNRPYGWGHVTNDKVTWCNMKELEVPSEHILRLGINNGLLLA